MDDHPLTTGTTRANRVIFNIILILVTVPILVGYVWILISTFAQRTYGLIPVDHEGHFGGLTLKNWSFLWEDPNIWQVTFNSLVLAIGLTIGVVTVSALAGYALSRIGFSGRRTFLGVTLILHAFPSVTLLISIYFVLRWISRIPIIGNDLPVIGGFGYNTLGGVILVMLALQLPLGIWLMKGFFDHISWDMERAALIDGASRFRVWWQILLPQIKPGIAALSIFSFISGWNEFLIPYTYMTQQEKSTIATYLNSLLSDTAPVNYSQVAAVGLFQLIPVIIFFIFTQEYLLSIFAGGTKGGT
ncbi:MAG TPA: carbohydrate ABC transporter permease [Anaerolineae bacterium]|nr:carbohydrate ABC transporter permease [Caldilineae bacterium]HID33820.1 carbohydrate ABC transporter permease [Anaerolineae bacterium]